MTFSTTAQRREAAVEQTRDAAVQSITDWELQTGRGGANLAEKLTAIQVETREEHAAAEAARVKEEESNARWGIALAILFLLGIVGAVGVNLKAFGY